MNAEQFKQFLETQHAILAQLVAQSVTPRSMQSAATSTSINTALLPNFDQFDEGKESFRKYKQRFQNYVAMKIVTNNKAYWEKLLLNSIRAKTFNMSSLTAPQEPTALENEELIKVLETHLALKRNVLVSQHQFLLKYQGENQSIARFVADLRTINKIAGNKSNNNNQSNQRRTQSKYDQNKNWSFNRNRSLSRHRNPLRPRINYQQLGIDGMCLRCGK